MLSTSGHEPQITFIRRGSLARQARLSVQAPGRPALSSWAPHSASSPCDCDLTKDGTVSPLSSAESNRRHRLREQGTQAEVPPMQTTPITAPKALQAGRWALQGRCQREQKRPGTCELAQRDRTLRSGKHRNCQVVVTCFFPLPHSENCHPEHGLGPWVCLLGEKEGNAGERGPA